MTDQLATLRSRLLAAGWSAEPTDSLDPEGERLAREGRKD